MAELQCTDTTDVSRVTHLSIIIMMILSKMVLSAVYNWNSKNKSSKVNCIIWSILNINMTVSQLYGIDSKLHEHGSKQQQQLQQLQQIDPLI